ncbi:phosphoribosyltransferase [Geobacter sp. SVR]|uniref:phosphoribosyltransferase n=1 Tax=Geobacter sp. SVR TaxID=2495594 RepID=UPI0015635CD8|nr:hypothetical protein [Geobacter sp. SVR]
MNISKMFLYLTARSCPDHNYQLAGLESGAVPLLTGISQAAKILGQRDLNVFSVRKERKAYGLRNVTEGLPNGAPVMIVDDLCNSSASMKRCHDMCISEGMSIYPYAFCVVNKVNKAVHAPRRRVTDMYLPDNIKIIYLYDLDDFGLSNPSH